MKILARALRTLFLLVYFLVPTVSLAADIDRFAGTYVGEAEFVFEGEAQRRDMTTKIVPVDKGFIVSWTSVTHRIDGGSKEKSYTIQFVQSQRENIFGSAMKTNMFGKQIPLDPMLGEPYVWSRLEGETLSVFSLYINPQGEYEIQEYHRTLAPGGLNLLFRRVSNGIPGKEINAFLERQD